MRLWVLKGHINVFVLIAKKKSQNEEHQQREHYFSPKTYSPTNSGKWTFRIHYLGGNSGRRFDFYHSIDSMKELWSPYISMHCNKRIITYCIIHTHRVFNVTFRHLLLAIYYSNTRLAKINLWYFGKVNLQATFNCKVLIQTYKQPLFNRVPASLYVWS